MSGTDRRAVLRLAAGALLVPVASAFPRTAGAHPSDRIAPPFAPMRYTRRLDRTLGDDASFIVDRSYRVLFRARASGFSVEGEQIDVSVSAPESLSAFARLEREREERGLFPILLDDHGKIVGLAPEGTSGQLDAAVRELSAELERRPFDGAEREELRSFARVLQEQAGRMVALLPLDLFAPAERLRRESRQVALPGGGAGEVAVTFTAIRDPLTGLMREASRVVETELSGDLRRTVETWQLEPLG